jgi:hypothetical protein
MAFRSARTRAVIACALAVVATACAGNGPSQRPQAADVPSGTPLPTATSSAAAPTSGTGTQDGPADASQARPVTDPAVVGGHDGRHAPVEVDSGTSAGEAPGLRGDSPYVWRLRAVVTPTCVRAGGTATLTVATAPGAAIAYVAVYAGDKSGAEPPFGYGYGGNAGGYTDQSGGWTQTWTVRPDAPLGPAKVTVGAGSHQTNKQVDAPFTVVDPVTRQC